MRELCHHGIYILCNDIIGLPCSSPESRPSIVYPMSFSGAIADNEWLTWKGKVFSPLKGTLVDRRKPRRLCVGVCLVRTVIVAGVYMAAERTQLKLGVSRLWRSTI